ncbi:MAG: putative selenium-dependent hydroxylase accessory protein YqeC [Ruminococcus sp.]|nr:putative selenium-dependent hydroxylase accessory protein YqeC [Ruminococcus sp.]
MKISQILRITPGVTALIGGGGKTTLMYKLAEELSAFGTVIVCTTTKIYEPDDTPVLTGKTYEEIVSALKSRRIICVGTKIASGKLSAPAVSFDSLRKLADYIIVEADGAHGLPIKAHADYEPVIPAETNKTVLVIGADAFGQPIAEVCHRPELFSMIACVDMRSAVTPQIIGRVITSEGYGDCLLINKAEDDKAKENAAVLARMLKIPVTAGSLKREEYTCLH